MRNANQIADILRSYAYRFANEAELQKGVVAVLCFDNITYEREKTLDKSNRIDFFLPEGNIGLEVKVDESAIVVARQLLEYARCDLITSLILVTSRLRHRQIPIKLNGKSVLIVTTTEASL